MKRSGIAVAPFPTDLAETSIGGAARARAMMVNADAVAYTGSHVSIDGRPLLNFGSCSYLGLEVRPELKQGAIDAVLKYGTQFPFAQPFVRCALYADLQEALEQMTGGHVLVAPSTTLGHIASLPVLIRAQDAVILDQFAHASLYTAARLIRGAHNEILPHGRVDMLEERITALSKEHERVWYVLDGLYSMRGDFAPLDRLANLLRQHPSLRLYVDDAHCTSWLGRSGRGYALDYFADRERVTVALSLNKAFSAAGGAVVFATEAERDRVRHVGGPMLFSGGIQPPLLGAAVASARLHLTAEFAALQAKLQERIARIHSLASELGIPLASTDRTPIAFIPCGRHEVTFALCDAMKSRGFYIAPAVFPGVPYNKSGLRLTASLHNSDDEADAVMHALAQEFHAIQGTTPPSTRRPSPSSSRPAMVEGSLALASDATVAPGVR